MRILFIGNSHTFANAMPFQVREMLTCRGINAEVWAVTPGGRNLAWHAGEPGTQQAITMHDWDFIVLQQQTHPFDGADQLAADCQALSPYLAASGASVVLYSTWKAKAAPQSDQDVLDKAFARVAAERSYLLAAVGLAWRLVQTDHPAVELYNPDGSHASPAGSYLAGCVIFSTLTGQSPAGLPARLATRGQTLVELDDATARSLQSATESVMQA